MKTKLLTAMPAVFSLRNHGGYDKIVARTGAERMMRDSWTRVGKELNKAITTVGRDVEKQKNCK
jgi:hypothetical protein